MKKSVLASLLALATIFPGSVSLVYGQAAASGQITIKDPQEYNDYTNAEGQATPAAKAAAIEAFLTKYPNSVVKNDLLEQLMLTYQGDPVKMLDAADRLLAADPVAHAAGSVFVLRNDRGRNNLQFSRSGFAVLGETHNSVFVSSGRFLDTRDCIFCGRTVRNPR